LAALSGRRHEVITAICVLNADLDPDGRLERLVRTTVYFRRLGEADIDAYVATDEWRDKAGGYGIQGKGALLIDTIEGSYSNVVGLPVQEILESFRSVNFPGV
jgi:septum formation protein